MKLIVAIDKNWGIGKNNDLLFSLPLDMKHFKETTLNKVVVMGKNTLISLPNGKPLKNRVNIVLGGDSDAAQRDGFIAAKSTEHLFEILKDYQSQDVYIIGGATVYKNMLTYCQTAIITKVNADGNAELFFEDLDMHNDWELISQSRTMLDGGYAINFCEYKNNNVKEFSL